MIIHKILIQKLKRGQKIIVFHADGNEYHGKFLSTEKGKWLVPTSTIGARTLKQKSIDTIRVDLGYAIFASPVDQIKCILTIKN